MLGIDTPTVLYTARAAAKPVLWHINEPVRNAEHARQCFFPELPGLHSVRMRQTLGCIPRNPHGRGEATGLHRPVLWQILCYPPPTILEPPTLDSTWLCSPLGSNSKLLEPPVLRRSLLFFPPHFRPHFAPHRILSGFLSVTPLGQTVSEWLLSESV